jgi:predicted ester cyclase
MEQLKKNKEFVVRYFNAMSGITKTPEVCQQFLSDEELIEHITFFDTVFPKYEIFADEMIAEGNKVVVRGRLKGRHEGVLNGIPPTYKDVNFPFVISYEIENNKIVHHWLIADQAAMMEQLGLVGVAQE